MAWSRNKRSIQTLNKGGRKGWGFQPYSLISFDNSFDQGFLVPLHIWVTKNTHASNYGLTWRPYTHIDDNVLKK